MSCSRIIIIGAGVGGLALAQGLRRRNIDFALFERDALLDSRLQGYRIKIFAEMKSKLRGLLLDEAWSEFETTCAQTVLGETNLNAPDAAILASRKGHLPEGAALPCTADRGLLRRAMMVGIQDAVHFGKHFTHYEIADGYIKVFFADGSSEIGTFLVGADGSHSAVRKQFNPNIRFLNTNGCCIYGKSALGSRLKACFPQKHRQWMTVVRDESPLIQSIIADASSPITMVTEPVQFSTRESRNDLPEDYVHWGLLFHQDSCGLGEETLSEALRSSPSGLALEITSQWSPSIRCLLELQDTPLTSGMHVYSASPEIGAWESSEYITMLGDAVHLMSPSGGVGAVAALHDAATLAQTIADEKGILSAQSVQKFEQAMKDFAGACIRRSFVAGEKMFNMPSAERCRTIDL